MFNKLQACFMFHVGLFQLPVSNLQSDLRLIRKLDTTFVNNLKKRIQEDPTGPGVPPIAALCVNVARRTSLNNTRIHINIRC